MKKGTVKKEEKTIKLGNTEFLKGMCSKMALSKFKELYAGTLKSVDIEETFIALGGKLKTVKELSK